MKNKFLFYLLSIFVFLSFGFNVSAHATPITYEPGNSSILAEVPDYVRIHFSENIELNASSINIIGPNGGNIEIGNSSIDNNDRHFLKVNIKNGDQEGTYTVVWQVVSADDGHFTKGAFTFSIGKETITSAQTSGQIQIQHITSIPLAMTMWIELLGQSILLGVLLFIISVWKPLKRRFLEKISSEQSLFIERRINYIAIIGIVFIIIGIISLLVLKTLDLEQLRGTNFIETFKVFITTLDGTHAIGRAIIAIVFIGIFFIMRRRIFSSNTISAKEVVLCFIIFLMMLSRARVSHSAATNFYPWLSVFITAVHLMAKELWVGGLIVGTVVLLPVLGRIKDNLIATFSFTSFSKIISAVFGIAGITGAYVAWIDLKDPAYIFTTEWGNWLVILSIFAGILFVIRLYHQILVDRSAVDICQGKSNDRASRILVWSGYTFPLEAVIGIALICVTSFIIITTPPFPSEGFSFDKRQASQGALIDFRVAPYETNNFLVKITDEKSNTPIPLNNVIVNITNEENGIGPIIVKLEERYPGGYIFPRSILSIPGKWNIGIVTQRPDKFDANASFLVDYPKDVDQTRIDPEHRSFGSFEGSLLIIVVGIAAFATFLYRFSSNLNKICSNTNESNNISYQRALPGLASSFSFAFIAVVVISIGIWLVNENLIKTDFQKLCERDGNFWIQSVPMRDGVALSSDTVTGCTLNIGLYHFADPDEYAYFVRPRQSGAEVITFPEKPVAQQLTQITSRIYTIDKGEDVGPVEDLGIYHDRIMHMIIVGEDLQTFAHIHTEDLGPVTAEMKNNTTFPLEYVFPKAGRYTIVVNYIIGGKELTQQSSIDVAGEPIMEANSVAVGKLDPSLVKDFDGYHVTLETPEHMKAGEVSKLTYIIEDNSLPVMDMSPYLGAAMHLAVVRGDLGRVIHTHGQIYLPGSAFFQQLVQNYINYHSHFVPDKFGPKIQARVTFPNPGIYQLFGEFKHNGKVITTSFTVKAE